MSYGNASVLVWCLNIILFTRTPRFRRSLIPLSRTRARSRQIPGYATVILKALWPSAWHLAPSNFEDYGGVSFKPSNASYATHAINVTLCTGYCHVLLTGCLFLESVSWTDTPSLPRLRCFWSIFFVVLVRLSQQCRRLYEFQWRERGMLIWRGPSRRLWWMRTMISSLATTRFLSASSTNSGPILSLNSLLLRTKARQHWTWCIGNIALNTVRYCWTILVT